MPVAGFPRPANANAAPKGARVAAFANARRFPKERLWHVDISFNQCGVRTAGSSATYLGLGLMAPGPRTLPPRSFHAFDLYKGDARVSFDPCKVTSVAAWARHAAHEAAKRLGLDPVFIEQFVCGHGEGEAAKNARLSYLPAPTVAPKGRDGRICRLIIAEPSGAADPVAALLMRALGEAVLVDEDGEIQAELRQIGRAGQDRSLRGYVVSSKIWSSITPVILPGLDDGRSKKASELIRKAIAQAGVATPVAEIAVQREPFFPGAECAARYGPPAHLKRWPRVHARIVFASSVAGPLSIGGGRHSGFGLLCTVG